MKRRIPALALSLLLMLSILVSGVTLAAEDDYYILNNDGRPMTVRVMAAQLHVAEGSRAEVEHQGQLLGEDALIATGQMLRIVSDDGTIESIRPIVLIGDVTGTGVAGLGQVTRIAQSITGADPLTGVFEMAADINGSGSVDISDLFLAVAQMRSLTEAEEKVVTIEERPVYGIGDTLTDPRMLEFAFVDGHTEIPYLTTQSLVEFVNALLEAKALEATCTDVNAEVVTLEVPNGSMVEFNFLDGTICFSDYNLFFTAPYAGSILDPLTRNENPDGTARLIRRLPDSFERFGKVILIDVAGYDIDMFYKDGCGYVPFQTIADLFGTPATLSFIYNGEAVYMTNVMDLAPELKEMCYSVEPQDRTPELAEFTYNELCLLLDTQYGLKEQHNIGKFNSLFLETGLSEELLSTDPVVADNAITELCYAYFSDIHSAFVAPSPYAGLDAPVVPATAYPEFAAYVQDTQKMAMALAAANPDGVNAYTEVGNTAYILLTSFSWNIGQTYDMDELTPNPHDTAELIMYAHQQINREDSPIENVVIDLSVNTGGDVDAGAFVIGWFLGGQSKISMNDTFTEAQATTYYEVDVNGDGVFDENDSVSSKNRYCLIAAPSFSCGNLVPASFKASNEVTLLGKPSRGGACTVLPVTAADGTRFQISSNSSLSTVSNGSYYDVDRGVEPDIPITKVEHFYDREALTAFINGIYR